ncbi:hypothetical protein RND71_003411 [Anisodus tanguticus]|uniref:GOLD domain-containing protein n=1 Tax=Anisodus tanguticus TaxID=243964 RepID=A0AAE1SVU3_9SOLA|nr:hypothetical protein RND71_003411 [Anisodus tanguticus]
MKNKRLMIRFKVLRVWIVLKIILMMFWAENDMGIALELRKLEGAVEAIHENLIYLKSRESEMRSVSETTNARVSWFSIISLGVSSANIVLEAIFPKEKANLGFL